MNINCGGSYDAWSSVTSRCPKRMLWDYSSFRVRLSVRSAGFGKSFRSLLQRNKKYFSICTLLGTKGFEWRTSLLFMLSFFNSKINDRDSRCHNRRRKRCSISTTRGYSTIGSTQYVCDLVFPHGAQRKRKHSLDRNAQIGIECSSILHAHLTLDLKVSRVSLFSLADHDSF